MKKRLFWILAMTLGMNFSGSIFAAPAQGDATANLISAYEKIHLALVNDDLNSAKDTAAELAKQAMDSKNEPLMKTSEGVAKSDALDKAREAFKALSQEAVKLIKGKSGYYVMTCPMVKADWVQTAQKVSNPYMGKAMLDCGSMKQ